MEEKKKRRNTVIAVTGGICTGKSTIIDILKDCGATVLSCDSEIKKIKKLPKIKDALRNTFGDLAENNDALAELVFSDLEKLRVLESMLYPELHKVIKSFVSSNTGILFIEIPLLYEKNKESEYNKVILAKCSEFSQKQRCVKRRISVVMFENILKNQLPTIEKESRADYVIDTDRDFESVKTEILKIYREIKNEQSNFRP